MGVMYRQFIPPIAVYDEKAHTSTWFATFDVATAR
jgi:hypothetical protein